ncbi:MAG: glycogen debranching protein [Chloroflexi bacterium]|nr:MAG: glycogen debranching protein [Chloroflexota bacterium]
MIRLDAEECRDLSREWLVTNGLGGYASGTVTGPNTRRYHGLLMAALRPPVRRVLLLAELHASIVGADAAGHPLTVPSEMRLDGTLPAFRWAMEGRVLERRIWMEQGRNRTVISYRMLTGTPATLRVKPFFAHRPAELHRTERGAPDVHRLAHGWQVSLDGTTTQLEARPAGAVSDVVAWIHVEHEAERERVLDDEEELFSPGVLELAIQPGSPVTIIAGTDPLPDQWSTADSLLAARRFEHDTITALGDRDHDAMTRQLALAASQFRVIREGGEQIEQRTIIAGYPWFADWGRDTMIALRGLTLAAGYPDQARQILQTFIDDLDQGMLPNAFHDPGEATEYNTIDATLWLFQALHHYLEVTGDWDFVKDELSALEEVVRWHVNGTRFDIHMDLEDGLLTATAPGYGLTWMDARDQDWVVTPRHGKPVEIAALWYNALRLMSDWTSRTNGPVARFAMMAERARRSANARYWFDSGGYLYDVIDGPEGDDASLRPNQLMALGLTYSLVDGERARRSLDRVTEKLLTPFGLRTLSPDDPRYLHRFGGDHRSRDAAYQMGIVWPWLLGPYLDAHQRIHGDPTVVARVLAPFEAHFRDAGVGSISEIFEAEPPYRPAGAIAQAWSVGELLWHARRYTPR